MYISDPCTRYGIMGGCDEDCPVLNDGDCSIEDELAEDMDWYHEWTIEFRGFNPHSKSRQFDLFD